MFIAKVDIETMFSTYICTEQDWYGGREQSIYCTACGQEFRAIWRQTGFMGYGSWDGARMYCPKCGKIHSSIGNEFCYAGKKENVPLSMRLRLDEFKDHICFTVLGEDLIAGINGSYWTKVNYKEVFRFDIKKRKTTFKRGHGGCNDDMRSHEFEMELGNPLDREIFTQSSLRFLCAHESISTKQSDIKKILKELRELVVKKLSKSMGHKIKSMYVSSGSDFGMALLPIFNIAYRIVYTDLPNLTQEWRSDRAGALGIPMMKESDFDLEKMRRVPDSVSGLLEKGKLPNQRIFRRIIQERPFDLMIVVSLYKTFKDVNNFTAAYEKTKSWRDGNQKIDMKDLCNGLKELKKFYGDKDLLRLLNLEDKKGGCYPSQLRDIFNMYSNIGDAPRRELKRNPVRIRDLHDWLVKKNKEERHPSCRFDNTEPIRRRLSMQTDLINFFIPNHSDDLEYAGNNLHNCVGTYIKQVRDGQTHIVLIADDYGKLMACIEVNNGKIVQAKLNRNSPVKNDAKINAEVIEWAEKVGLKWRPCWDIREVRLPALITKIA